MIGEIITIGDEILIGQIVNTNSVIISKQLNQIGIEISQITTISDNKNTIVSTLKNSEKKADIIIITGGLGPTKDDVTKEALCEYFGDILVENKEVLKHIKCFFSKNLSQSKVNAKTKNQALLPSKAKILKNKLGTAPGMWFEKNNKVIVSLPGVTFEMETLMKEEVIPKLRDAFKYPYIIHRTFITYGIIESILAEKLSDWEKNLPKNIKLAYLPSLGIVRIRLSGKDNNRNLLVDSIETQTKSLKKIIGDVILEIEEKDDLELKIKKEFVDKKKTLAIAESCTGGAISAALTKVAGASQYFKGGLVVYATQSKKDILKLPVGLIKKYSVVSKEVALAMAQNVKKIYKTKVGVATTGNAGPLKGDTNAPIGRVYIGIVNNNEKNVFSFDFGNYRHRVIQKTVNKTLELLYRINHKKIGDNNLY